MKKHLLFLLPLFVLASCGTPASSSELSSQETPPSSIALSSEEAPSSIAPTSEETTRSNEEISSEEALKEFENVSFSDLTVDYDGNPHILNEVQGAPEGTTIVYEGREEHVAIGEYPATATLTKEGYREKTLTAKLTISPLEFTGITFEDLTVTYDGDVHGITATGVPSFAKVTYKNNAAVAVGVYEATATITAPNYADLVLKATLTILDRKIEGVAFSDATFVYDGTPHEMLIEGTLPEGVSVTYENNVRTEVGRQTATATLSGKGYETLTLTATLTVDYADLKGIRFNDAVFLYNGNEHEMLIEGDLPEGASVEYTNNKRTEVGFQTAKALIRCPGYNALSLIATLRVIEFDPMSPIKTDESTPFTVFPSMKASDLKAALFQPNYTAVYEFGYKRGTLEDDTIYEEGVHERTYYAVDGDEYYSAYDYLEDEGFNYAQYATKASGSTITTGVDIDDADTSHGKCPAEAFKETFTLEVAATPFFILGQDEDDHFTNENVYFDGYYTHTTSFEVDTGRNTFSTMWQTNSKTDKGYIFHQTYKVTFYNIGNTKIDLPNALQPNIDKVDAYEPIGFELNGVTYTHYNDGTWHADITISLADLLLVEKGTYTLMPLVYGGPVAKVFTQIYKDNKDYSGYELNVYFGEDLYYAGDYENILVDSSGDPVKVIIRGITYETRMVEYVTYGGVIHYYGEWGN